MKHFIFLLLSLVITSGLFAQVDETVDPLLEWEKLFLEKDEEFRTSYFSSLSEMRRLSGLPEYSFPSISLSPNYTVEKLANGGNLQQRSSLGLSVAQSLISGGSLNLQVSPSFTHVLSGNTLYAVDLTSSVSFTQPWIFGDFIFWYPEDVKDIDNNWILGQKALVRWRLNRLQLLRDKIQKLLQASIDLQRQVLRGELLLWYEEKETVDLALVDAGRISVAEFNERLQPKKDLESEILEVEETLLDSRAFAQKLGINLIDIDVQETLQPFSESSYEKEILASQQELAVLDLQEAKKNAWLSDLADLPALQLSFQLLSPVSTFNGDFPSAFDSHFESFDRWGWRFGASMSWKLDPWDGPSNVLRYAKEESQEYEARERLLDEQEALNRQLLEKTKEIQILVLEQLENRFQLESERLSLFSAKVEVGQLTPSDLEFQRIQTEFARLDWLTQTIETEL
jgi:hypothetical protein